MVGLAQRQAYVGPIAEDGPMAQLLQAQSSSGVLAAEGPPVVTSEALRARDFAAPALALLVTGTAAAIVFRQHLAGLQGMGYLGVFLGTWRPAAHWYCRCRVWRRPWARRWS
jgi:hypothetical protein